MFKQIPNPIRFTAIFGLLLTLALSEASAAMHYSGSMTIGKGGGNWMQLVKGKNKVWIMSYMGCLDPYMEEQGINEVTITADLEEEWVPAGGKEGYYRLTFTFGPAGAYFTPLELELQLGGRYVQSGADVKLYDANGEAIPYTVKGGGKHITYLISHFSSYYYDDYDEY